MKTKEINREKKTLLLYDDQSFIIRSMFISLEDLGWNVEFVSKIDDLFLRLKQRHFDVIILDIMSRLPQECKHVCFTELELCNMDDGMNTGVVLAKKIWDLDEYKDTPIIFLSGKSNPIPNDRELQQHNCSYLRKPVFARDIDQVICIMLNQ